MAAKGAGGRAKARRQSGTAKDRARTAKSGSGAPATKTKGAAKPAAARSGSAVKAPAQRKTRAAAPATATAKAPKAASAAKKQVQSPPAAKSSSNAKPKPASAPRAGAKAKEVAPSVAPSRPQKAKAGPVAAVEAPPALAPTPPPRAALVVEPVADALADLAVEPAAALPKGPYADRTTEELWQLYRAEVVRLRTEDADAAFDASIEEDLDEDAELRRLEALARAEAAREAALAAGAEEPDEGSVKQPEPVRPSRGPKGSPELERLRNELIERHYPLVRYIAERLLQTLPKSIELDDLISAGQFGLMDAIRGFDPDRGIKFKTYCSTRIRGSILDQLRSQDWVPRLVRLKAARIDKALQRLTGEYGREPTHAELARALELEHGELSREIMESQARTMFSLSEKWDDDDEGSIEKVEILEDRTAIDPVHELNRRDLMVFMTRSLTHKERFIIEQYYQYGHTMREIGEMLTLTESRVCQIHSNVMGRLKSLLAQRGESLSG